MARPIKKYRAGQISCALWENDVNANGRTVTMLKCTVERRYKNGDGEWKSSQSFGRNDIPLVKWCLDQAFTAMIEERADSSDVDEEVIE